MQNLHFSNTRKIQRTLTNYLKAQGIKATNKSVKTLSGWQTTVKAVSIKKPVKSVCKSLSGRSVPVLTK